MEVEGHLSSISFSSGIPESDVLKDEVFFPDFYTLVTDPFLLSLVTRTMTKASRSQSVDEDTVPSQVKS